MLSSIYIILPYSYRYNLNIFNENLKYVSHDFFGQWINSYLLVFIKCKVPFNGILERLKKRRLPPKKSNYLRGRDLNEQVSYKNGNRASERDHKPRRMLQMVYAKGV